MRVCTHAQTFQKGGVIGRIKPFTSDCLIVLTRMTEGWELQEASLQLQEFRHTCMVTPQIYGEPAFRKSDESTTFRFFLTNQRLLMSDTEGFLLRIYPPPPTTTL